MLRAPVTRSPRAAHIRTVAAFLLCLAMLVPALAVPLAARAADPSPSPVTSSLRMTVSPMLGGTVRPGDWMAVRVHLENDGPAIEGEIRVVQSTAGEDRYGTPVQLPTGARQDHIIYAQPSWVGARLSIQLVAQDTALASQRLSINAVDPSSPTVVVVAEHPEAIVGDIRAGAVSPISSAPTVIAIAPEDLPPRVEAWSAIDRLVWQDVDSSRLSSQQLDALRTWVGAGGRFAIVGGFTGITGLGSFQADMLPFRPSITLDADPPEMSALLGTLPASATTSPAIAGTLDRGIVLARSGDHVMAAQTGYGQGSVTIVGIDPAEEWLTGTPAATGLWRRLLASHQNTTLNPLLLPNDGDLVDALNNLPAADLPDLMTLLGLLLLYILLIGPVNYLVLRRLDRREWAWLTMPALSLLFAAAAYAMGVGIRGTDVIVNQVGIVRGSAGTDRGVGAFYVGVYSPTRQTYDVKVADAALLTKPAYLAQQGQAGVPLDVLSGDPSELRGYQVGFGVVRPFRAEAAVAVPMVTADLSYHDGVLTGTLTNQSTQALHSVALVFGTGVVTIAELAPGATVPVSVDVAGSTGFGSNLSERILGAQSPDGQLTREAYTRQAVLNQLTNYSDTLGGTGSPQQSPVILAWTGTPTLGVDTGASAQQEGDTLLVLPASASIAGATVFPNSLLGRSLISSQASDATDQGTSYSLSRGSMVLEVRPTDLGGTLTPTALALATTQNVQQPLTGRGRSLAPMPDAQQPSQDDPLSAPLSVTANRGLSGDGLPEVQLYDRGAGRWVELPHPGMSEFNVPSPERYVDDTGSFLVRLVNRGDPNNSDYFSLLSRLEGDVQ